MTEWSESWSDAEEDEEEDEMAVVSGMVEHADWNGLISKAEFILSLERKEKKQVLVNIE